MCRLDVAGTCYLRGTRHFRLMTNRRTLVSVGFLLAATSAFAQSGSPAEASATTPTPTATPVNEGDLVVWNGFASKLGWRDFMTPRFQELKKEQGVADRHDIACVPDLMDFEEGRKS